MAALRCCALALVSFWRSSKSLTPVFFVMASASSLYLVSSASMSSVSKPPGHYDFGAGQALILTNIFRNLRERHACILGPEKVIGSQIIRLFCDSFCWVIGINRGLDSDPVQLRLWSFLASLFLRLQSQEHTLKTSKHRLWYVQE